MVIEMSSKKNCHSNQLKSSTSLGMLIYVRVGSQMEWGGVKTNMSSGKSCSVGF